MPSRGLQYGAHQRHPGQQGADRNAQHGAGGPGQEKGYRPPPVRVLAVDPQIQVVGIVALNVRHCTDDQQRQLPWLERLPGKIQPCQGMAHQHVGGAHGCGVQTPGQQHGGGAQQLGGRQQHDQRHRQPPGRAQQPPDQVEQRRGRHQQGEEPQLPGPQTVHQHRVGGVVEPAVHHAEHRPADQVGVLAPQGIEHEPDHEQHGTDGKILPHHPSQPLERTAGRGQIPRQHKEEGHIEFIDPGRRGSPQQLGMGGHYRQNGKAPGNVQGGDAPRTRNSQIHGKNVLCGIFLYYIPWHGSESTGRGMEAAARPCYNGKKRKGKRRKSR